MSDVDQIPSVDNVYDDIVPQFNAIAPAKAVTSLTENPDQGARALALSRSTGVAPEVIHSDLEGFEQEHKQALVSGIVKNNDYIAAYIRGNKLADVVSNDDYGNLDNISSLGQQVRDSLEASKKFIQYLPGFQILKAGAESFEQPMLRIEDVQQDGLAGALVRSADVIAKSGRALMAAPMVGPVNWVEKVVGDVTGDQNLAGRVSREFAGIIESEMGRGGSGIPHEVSNLNTYLLTLPREQRPAALEQIGKFQEASKAAEPWTKAGLEPPAGLHPIIDDLKVKGNEANIDRIDKLLSEAQNSMTKERDPELFRSFIEQHVENSEIGISAERIIAEYGDGPVEPGKGPLGWVPGIAEKVEAARAFGDDVRIPLKDWLTNMDPAVAKEFHDDMRTWPGAITKNEAKVPVEPRPVVDAPLAQVRDAMGTEPVFSIGDRKLELKAQAPMGDFHEFQIVDQTGKPVGELSILPDPTTKQLYVGNINGLAGLYSNAFGPSLMRDLKRQLKEAYPEYETITGHRVSGAREKAGVWEDAEKSNPVVRLHIDDLANDDAAMRQMFDDAYMRKFDHGVEGFVLPKELYRQNEQALTEVVRAELARITPNTEFVPAGGIAHPSTDKSITGTYLPGLRPQILIDMLDPGAKGIAHHEAIHALYRQGLFKADEWAALNKAVEAEGWIERYGIKDRYGDLTDKPEYLREEAIAEAFRDWAATKDTVNHPQTLVTQAFQKLWDFLQSIKAKFTEILGREPTFNELFEKAYSGEVGQRSLKDRANQAFSKPNFSVGPRAEEVYTEWKRLHDEANAASDRRDDLGAREFRTKADKLQDSLGAKESARLDELDSAGYSTQEAEKIAYRNEQLKTSRYDRMKELSRIVDNLSNNMRRDDPRVQEIQKLFDYEAKAGGDPFALLKEAFTDREKNYLESGGSKIDTAEIINDNMRQIKALLDAPQELPRFSIGDRMDNLRAEAAGLDSKSFKKMQELIKQRHEEDLQAAIKRAEKEQAATQTKEWKENAREIRKQVETDIRQRPDVAVDLLVGSGEMQGQKLKQRYPLRAEDLTDLQKSMLPRHYYAKDGLPVDGVANMFGFHSGDAMIDKLIEYRADKADMTAQERLAATIKEETDRRMEAQYGKLQDNIMSEAMDQALSETNLNILAEEWQGAAMKAGVATVDKDVAKAAALDMFAKMKIGEVNLDRTIAAMGKFSRDAERKLIAGDHAGALVDMQRKYMTGLIAAETRKLQKEQASFDKTAKQFSKREVPSMDPEYTNYVHDILMRVGKPVRRSIQDLEATIAASESKGLPEFLLNKTMQLREVPVWDQLLDSAWRKDLKELTVDEFRAVNDSIKTLVHNGRDEMKLTRAGEAEDFALIKEQMINTIAESAAGEIKEPKAKSKLRKLPMQYYVQHLQMENVLGRWDDFDSKGVWTQFVMRDLIDGANQVDAWKKEYAEKIKKIGDPPNLHRTVDNTIFRDQDTGTMIPMTRKNLIAVMLNTGNDGNLVKMAKGYGLEPHQVMDWVHERATPADWKYVQGIWDTFKDIKVKSDTMYRSLTGGVAPESIVTRPVIDPMGNKVADGGYYPVIFHPEMEGSSKKLMGPNALEEQNYVRATTPAGYTKSRTGYVAPLALDLDAMPGRISQMLHDIGLRPAVLNASKVFYDKDIRSAVRKFYGEEYRETLIPYLRGVANASNYMDKNQMAMTRASEFIRQNMITTLVGLNPGTVMKHGPTAAVLSIKEVGGADFAKAVKSMFSINDVTGESNWQFAIKNSLELQRRDRNWQETLYGATAGLTPGEKFEPWRQRIMEWSSKPVALSDMISAVPTWIARYEKEINAGASHGDAVFEADRSVRRAHGSTAPTNRTAMQRNFSPWMTSIYNFWSEIMNRQMESIWRAGRAVDAVKEGDHAAAMAQGKYLIGAAFAFVIWPAIVENYVSPHPHKEDDSWAKKAGTQMMYTLGSSWVGIRDLAAAFSFGRDPQFGLTGTTYQTMSNLYRDFNKEDMLSKQNRGKLLQDGATLMGALTGMVPAQVGKAARFAHDVNTGKENPRNAWQWLVGLRYGTTDKHSQSFEQYMKGH